MNCFRLEDKEEEEEEEEEKNVNHISQMWRSACLMGGGSMPKGRSGQERKRKIVGPCVQCDCIRITAENKIEEPLHHPEVERGTEEGCNSERQPTSTPISVRSDQRMTTVGRDEESKPIWRACGVRCGRAPAESCTDESTPYQLAFDSPGWILEVTTTPFRNRISSGGQPSADQPGRNPDHATK